MSVTRIVGVAYGAAAISALREVLAEIKVSDPLSPATVLVPNNIAGIVARRALATGVLPGRRGIAGVHFTTLTRLAEQVAAPQMSPRTPATRAAVAAAWRSELDYGAGSFAAVRDHPATIRAVSAVYRELRELTPSGLDSVEAGGSLQRELVDLHRRVAHRVGERSYDTVDLLIAAARSVTARQVPGAVVLFLPQRLPPSQLTFVRSLADRTELTVILGLTGVARADAAGLESLRALDEHPNLEPPRPPTAAEIRHHSDSDDEVRGVVHSVLATLLSTPAHRIAVLYATPNPYARLLHEQLGAAGVVINGPGFSAVDERAISRGFLGILSWGPDFSRVDLFQALSHAPIRDLSGGDRIPVARWERVSRTAAVVGGLDWEDRLRRFVDEQLSAIRADRAAEDPRQNQIDARQREVDTANALSAFTGTLCRRLADGAALTEWPALARWASDLFHDLYGDTVDLGLLPPGERYAAAVIEQVLPALGALATLEGRADLQLLVEVLTEELLSARPRVGRVAEGVFVGPISAAVGLALDAVFVVGLSEDSYPGRAHVEALLPDRIRDSVDGLPGSRDRLDTQHRDLLAALMSADRVVASFARGDLRRNTLRLPSRWLLPTFRELTGDHRLPATRWTDADSPAIVGAPSYAATLGRSAEPATEQEWRVRSVATGGPRDHHTGAAYDLLVARAGRDFTRYDGNLIGTGTLPDPSADGALLSATRLESYAVCPHAYFVQRLLGVQPLEHPEEIIVISAMDIGTLMHEAMDGFVKGQAGQLPTFGAPWSSMQRDQLLEIGAAKAVEFETRGLTGHPLLWTAERRRILADLGTMLDDDNAWRAELDARVVDSELSFGMGDTPPVTLLLGSGRSIRLRGSADKVDQSRDGTLLITDIKTGGPGRFAAIKTDPIAAGTKLQLPLYALAARQQLGDHPVVAQYWFVRKGRRGNGPERYQVPLNTEVEARFLSALDVLVTSIATGLFPAKAPEAPDFAWVQCRYCNPDGLGHGAARERWNTKRSDPLLRSLVALLEPGDES